MSSILQLPNYASAMIKILRVIARLNVGGPAIHAILLSNALNKIGYRDILVCGKVSESEGDMGYLAKAYGIEPVYIPELGREISFKKDIKVFLKLYSIIKKERPDIIHTHTAKAGALGRLAAICAGVPIKIHTFHGHIFDGYFNPARARMFLFIERFLAIFTDRIIMVSKAVKEEIINKLKVANDSRSIVIPLGLDLNNFINYDRLKGEFHKKHSLPEDTILIGIVGRLVPIKNHKMFLDVARRIKDMLPELKVKFVIVGDGECRNEIELYAEKIGISSSVIFTGWVDDVAGIYVDLDIVALTSLNEGTPVSLIEAMASAKPVISSDVGGVKDIIRDNENGFLTESRNVSEFCFKLSHLICDPEKRKTFGLRGRELVAKIYNKDRLVEDIDLLYKDLLSSKSSKNLCPGKGKAR